MPDNKTFVSPGVFTSEKDLTFVAQQVGVTTLGIVGETLKGPAFEPIFITDYEEYQAIFGGLSPKTFGNSKPKYEASYIAKHYLNESNQLFVTRILGLTGYDAGHAWAVVASANYDPDTISGGTGTTTTFTADFTGTTYDNITDVNAEYLYSLGLFPNGATLTTSDVPGVTGDYPDGIVFTKVGSSFSGVSATITQTGTLTGTSGTVSGTVTTYTATPYTEYEGKVIAMLRSRGDYVNDELFFRVDQSVNGIVADMSSAETNPLGNFALSASSSGLTSTVIYDVSLDSTNRNYLPRVIGSTCNDKDTRIWVEEIYPNMLDDMIDGGYILGLNTDLIHFTTFNNYQQSYQTPETPWVVSELRGNVVDKLFKFISISDGDAANKEIKISIQNINPDNKTFDIVVREFNDRDSRPSIIERFARCTMDPNEDNYVGQRVGTADGEFELRSRYIMLVLNPNAPIDSFPAGFEGYRVRDYVGTNGNALAPDIDYKASYDLTNEKLRKVYLGISDVNGIDQNMFNYKGYTNDSNPSTWTATTPGYHMDSGATVAGDFVVGCCPFRDSASIVDTDYESIQARKFTLVPYLGFDGWNCYRTTRTNTDRYKIGKSGFASGLLFGEFEQISNTEGTSDYYAYLTGIRTFENPESVNINVFTTPGIDYVDNLDLVEETIDMIEEERADSIYLLTSQTEQLVPLLM